MSTRSDADWAHEPRAVDRRRAVQLIADRTLVEGVARGESTAIESLVHRFAGRIACFLMTRAVPPQLARQLTVDILAAAIAEASEYDGSAGIYSWLRRRAVQQLMEITHQAHRRWTRPSHPLLSRLTPAELEWMVRTTRIDQIGFATRAADPPLDSLREQVAQLPRPQREVLLAYYGEDLGLEAISGRLHRGEAALRSLLDQAVSALADAGGMSRRAKAGVSEVDGGAARDDSVRETVPLSHNFLAAPRREQVTEIDLWTGGQAAPDELSLVADWLGLEESVHLVFHRNSITSAEVTLRRRLRPARNWRSWVLSAAATAALALLAWQQFQSTAVEDRAADARSSDVVAQGDGERDGSGSGDGRSESQPEPDEWTPFGDSDSVAGTDSVASTDSVAGGDSATDGDGVEEPAWWDQPVEPAAPAIPESRPADGEPTRPVPAVVAKQIDDLSAWRQRLYELVYARDWVALRDWTMATDFQGSATQRQWGQALARWGAGMARVEGNPELIKTGKLALALIDRAHHQQTYDAMQEYYASLDAEADDEFVRLHRRFLPARYPGLIPWPGDPEQLVTAWGAAELGGVLRKVAMSEESLAAARIDVARRLRGARPDTVRELARQYAGNPAVGRVYEWMAERSLEAMRWDDARQLIELAGSTDPSHAERWSAWRVALDRLQGRPVSGEAPAVDWGLSWGPPGVLPADWWQAGGPAADGRGEQAVAGTGAGIEASESPSRAGIRPVRWDVEGPPISTGLRWVDQPSGVDSVRLAQPEALGLAARQLMGTSVQNQLYLSGPEQCVGWDPIAKRSVWTYDSPVRAIRPPAKTAGASIRPPVIDGDRVVLTLGTQCYCLERESGELIWRTLLPPNMVAISRPVVRPDRYSWLALKSDEGELVVQLLHLDPFTGDMLQSHELFRLRNSWHVFQQCELAEMGTLIAASWGGATSVFDLEGNLYWVRETTAVQPTVDPYLGRVARQAPVVSANHVWSWQAGAPVIDCCELRTGRRVWRATVADLQRYVGGTDKLLVFQLRQGLVALDRMTGQIVWQRRVVQPWGPASWENGTGQVLVITQNVATSTDAPAWSAHWVNLADGRLLTSWPLNFGDDSVRVLGAVFSQPAGLAIAGVKSGETEVKIWSLAARS